MPVDIDELARKYGMQAGGDAPAPAAGSADALAQKYGMKPVVTSTITDDSGRILAPGTPDDALISHFGFNPEEIKKSPAYQANVQKYGSGLSFLLSDPKRNDWVAKIADSPVGDLGKGALDVVTGLGQLIRHGMSATGLGSKEDTTYHDLINRVAEEDYTQNVRHGNPNWFARMVGSAAVPLPGAKATSMLGAIAKGAESAIAQPVEVDGSGDYWTKKAGQAATGAIAAPIAAGAAKLVGKAADKVARVVTGDIPQEAADLMAAGEKHGVRLTYGDITRNPGAQKLEVSMEEVPGLGMPGYRKGQHDEAVNAVNRTASDLYLKFHNQMPAAIKDVEDAAKQGDEYARRLLDQIHNAGNDPDRTIQASIGLQNFRTRNEAEHLYNTVQDLVTKNGLGKADVPIDGTSDVLNWAIGDAKSAVVPNKRLVTLLSEIDKNLSGQATTYERLRRFRSDLGDIIREQRANDNAIIGEKGVGYLERLRGAVEGDLQYFIDNSGKPEIQKAASDADRYYRLNRVPFKDQQLTYAAATNEPDQILNRFMMEGKGDRAQKLYGALEQRAQAAVRYEMVRRAMDEATDPTKGVFSPQKFSGYLTKLEEPYNVFFTGKDRVEMDGLRNLMSHIARAGQFAENPPTGNRMIGAAMKFGGPAAAAAGAAVNPVATAFAAGTLGTIAGLSKFLLTTDKGKQILLSAGSAKAGSPAMDQIIGWIAREAPQLTGAATGKAVGQQ
jgi:hypothetical protein